MLGLTVAPATIFDPGFILSFGATLGILLGVPRLTRLSRADRRRAGVRQRSPWTLLAPPALYFARPSLPKLRWLPIAAALFGRVTVAGLLLNFVAIPLMTVVQVGSLAGLGMWLWDRELARWCGYVVHLAAARPHRFGAPRRRRAVAVARRRAARVGSRRCLLSGARRGSAAAAACRGSQRGVAALIAIAIVAGPHGRRA